MTDANARAATSGARAFALPASRGHTKRYSSRRGVSGEPFIYPRAGIVRSTDYAARRNERPAKVDHAGRLARAFSNDSASAASGSLEIRQAAPSSSSKGGRRVTSQENEEERGRSIVARDLISGPPFVTAHRNCIITSARYVIAIVAASREKT